jgi:GxxExxY protein
MDDTVNYDTIFLDIASEIFRILGDSHSEKTYQEAVKVELRQRNINYSEQYPLSVYYKNSIVGYMFADILVHTKDTIIIIELKAVTQNYRISSGMQQIKTYMSNIPEIITKDKKLFGYLINFGKTDGPTIYKGNLYIFFISIVYPNERNEEIKQLKA